ncbi:hypothetical protein ACFS07_10005 [Undibacterium arcticum]
MRRPEKSLRSRWLPPNVAHRLATKAPHSKATNIHSAEYAAALRALSAASLAAVSASLIALLNLA